MLHPFDGIADKLGRATDHIKELTSEINRFIDDEPHSRISDYNSEQAESFRLFHQQRSVPLRISVITGEVLYQLRSCLDHAVCIFVERAGGTPTINTQYPIFLYRPIKPDEISRYKGQTNPIDPNGPVGTIIEKTQPYHRGNKRRAYALSILKELSNADKHRALTLHVVSVRPEIRLTFKADDWSHDATFDNPGESTTVGPINKATTGYEVVNVQRHLTTDVAFDKFGTVKNERVVQSILWLRGYVNGLLDAFKATIT